MKWFEGRLPLWIWVRAKLSMSLGFDPCTRVHDAILCRLGFHCWMDGGLVEPGEKMCRVCYQSKPVKAGEKPPAAPVAGETCTMAVPPVMQGSGVRTKESGAWRR